MERERSTVRRNSAERNWPTLSPTEQSNRVAGGKSGQKTGRSAVGGGTEKKAGEGGGSGQKRAAGEKTGSGQCRTEPGALHQEEARRLRVPDSQIFLNGDKQGRQRGAGHVVQEKQQRNKSRPRQGCPERHGNIFRGHETLLTVISCTIAASSLKGQTADEGPGEEAP